MNKDIYCHDCRCLEYHKEGAEKVFVCKKYDIKLEKHLQDTVKCFPCRNNREEIWQKECNLSESEEIQ